MTIAQDFLDTFDDGRANLAEFKRNLHASSSVRQHISRGSSVLGEGKERFTFADGSRLQLYADPSTGRLSVALF